jgi:hypothetical protein
MPLTEIQRRSSVSRMATQITQTIGDKYESCHLVKF